MLKGRSEGCRLITHSEKCKKSGKMQLVLRTETAFSHTEHQYSLIYTVLILWELVNFHVVVCTDAVQWQRVMFSTVGSILFCGKECLSCSTIGICKMLPIFQKFFLVLKLLNYRIIINTIWPYSSISARAY